MIKIMIIIIQFIIHNPHAQSVYHNKNHATFSSHNVHTISMNNASKNG